MKYCLEFTTGELAGQSFSLDNENVITIGRSRSNTICLKALDVSGRHLILRKMPNDVLVTEVLSSKITRYNGLEVEIGKKIDLKAGDSLQMGESTIFVLTVASHPETIVSDGLKTEKPGIEKSGGQANPADVQGTVVASQAVVPDEIETLAAPAGSSPSAVNLPGRIEEDKADNETIAIQTRIASGDELENIKRSLQTKQRTKAILWTVSIIMFLAVTVSLYFYLKPDREEWVSWPVDEKGEYLNDFVQVAPYLAVGFPKVSANQVEKKDGMLDIISRIGKQRDVPLHIAVSSETEQTTLFKDRDTAFEEWIQSQRDKDNTINFALNKATFFINVTRGAGIPLNYVSYTRRVADDEYFGYAVFLRNEDNIHTFMIEVPLWAQWRSEDFLRQQLSAIVIFAIRRTPEFWEGAQHYRKESSIAQDLDEAKGYMKRKSPIYWEKVFFCLKSALIKAKQNDDQENLTTAKSLLARLRAEQTEWYNAQKLAYQYAERNDDTRTMQSVQSACDSVFTPEFQQSDYRYELIKRKDWK